MKVQSGLDRIAAGEKNLRGRKVALLCHGASVDASLRSTREILEAQGAEIVVIFGPEHGLGGAAQDMIGVEDAPIQSGPRMRSLYGESAADLHPRPGDLDGVELVVIDLQDVGSRYYTYVWTAAFLLRSAARQGIPSMVLDRPNPLGGEVVEGMPQRGGYRSFVGAYEVAVRHGMTIGEMLRRVQRLERLDEQSLEVVPMQGWQRSMFFDETGLPWVMPSPNMPDLSTAIVYPGGCVLEGTTLSEGRGTTRPFELWGAPELRGDDAALREGFAEVDGATLRPAWFEPTFQKHARTLCRGVQVHVTDRRRFRSYQAYLRWIPVALGQREAFPWRTEVYEYERYRPAIDLLTGGPEYRQLVNAKEDLEGYLEQDAAGAVAFAAGRDEDLIYR